MLETSSQRLRQAALTNLLLRAFDWIRDTVEGSPAGVQVKRKPGGAWVPVPRLADRSGVQKPAPAIATAGESTYSHTGSRGLAWYSSAPGRVAEGLSEARKVAVSGSSTLLVQRAESAASG